ncbi:uncharacterized protein F5147DRAFT_696845 [Suillus discolor]|uniref:Uncharacterized protein n=1 Tax=Suillus discolor TaxID=1912936 RepID=A0A9P7F731_9AGAM|nr:uncharacterized protein F5147DRAFT_696845 [Suillus discolor]KAG2107724.1 hypothetical protein F5147DRAFT_696845 [Suillus discolor]
MKAIVLYARPALVFSRFVATAGTFLSGKIVFGAPLFTKWTVVVLFDASVLLPHLSCSVLFQVRDDKKKEVRFLAPRIVE